MKITKSGATLTLCALSAFGTLVVLNTQQAKAEKACSNKDLRGSYEIQVQGYLNKTEPYALTAIDIFDGNGKYTGTVQARSIAGEVTSNFATQGTYQVNSDCSFTRNATRSDGTSANYNGVVYDNGNKFAETENDPGTIVNTKAQRVKSYDSSH